MPSMSDVAREAGVSVATVSRVLSNNGEGVRPVTQEAVRDAAARLGYRYNGVAAALRRRRTMQIGVVVPRIANPFFADVVEALERALAPLGFDLLLADAQEDPTIERARIQSLMDRRVDALVVVPTDDPGSVDALSAVTGIPLIQLDRRVEGLAADWIGADHRAGIALVVSHLHERGYERLAFVGARSSNTAARERLAGFQEAHPAGPILLGEFSMDWGAEAFRDLRERTPGVTAIVCGNDLIAYGVVRTCHELGLAVPDDLAVTGFDDLPFSSLIAPGLTTVRQPVAELAATAARQLRERLDPLSVVGSPRRTVLECELVVRGSSST